MRVNYFCRFFKSTPQYFFSQTIMKHKHTLISIEGNIGSGKSTLLKLMQEKYKKIKYIQEPVNEWQSINGNPKLNILQEFYTDPKRWAYTLQVYAFYSRLMHWKIILDEENIQNSNHVILSERSIQADREIFAVNGHKSGLINDLEFALYNNFYDWLVSEIFGSRIEKQLMIYLKVDPVVAFSRLQKRGRIEEKDSITLDYIVQIHDRHEEWLKKEQQKCLILTIDGNEDFEFHPQRLNELFTQIDEFLANNVKHL